MKHDSTTFLSGCAPFYDFFFFAKELDELAQSGQPNSTFFVFDETDPEAQYRQYDVSVGWPAIAMATSKPPGAGRLVVALGPNGNYWELEPAPPLERAGQIADFQGNLRNVAVIDDVFYACGMGRRVLRRESPGVWRDIGPGTFAVDPDIIGFEDISGYGANEIYAVGWGGEIWWCDAGQWKRIDSPTSVILRAVCCAEDAVYAVGQGGTMVRGRYESWDVLATGRQENLMDIAVYRGEVRVCTNFRLLRWMDGELVNDMDFVEPTDQPATCLNLLCSADGLISLGEKDVFQAPRRAVEAARIRIGAFRIAGANSLQPIIDIPASQVLRTAMPQGRSAGWTAVRNPW
jgi:hypothetical protein